MAVRLREERGFGVAHAAEEQGLQLLKLCEPKMVVICCLCWCLQLLTLPAPLLQSAFVAWSTRK